MSSSKTKKVKQFKHDKKSLWSQFDKEILDETLECVYSSTDRDVCDCCAGSLLVTDEGFKTCTNKKCGILYTDSLDQSAEWRYYGAEDSSSSDPTRCGMPINPLLQESSFGCKVIISGSSTYEMRKIMRYTDWIGMPYKEKSQYDEFQRITILGNQSGIPKLIIDDAMRFHKRVSETKTFRGHNRDGIVAASIYLSARVNNYPRTAKEIAQIFRLDSASATRGCKNAVSIINELESEMANTDKTILCQTTPESFIDRYCSRLNINAELTKVCKFVAIRIQRNNLIPENTPHSVAAGIVYFIAQACNMNVSKRDISSISEISEVTINKCYKKLADMTNILIPNAILEKYA
jgi:transcription initiation factor TFIIB